MEFENGVEGKETDKTPMVRRPSELPDETLVYQ
jgi:hypothetical protein